METRSGIEHFWSPPPGEHILGMAKYEDVIVVATDNGVYVIGATDKWFDSHQVQKLSIDTVREFAIRQERI